jgi:fluoride exporter
MSLKLVLMIGAGGFIGTIARYFVQILVARFFLISFPLGTLMVNVFGSFLIGLIYAMAEKNLLVSTEWRLFLLTGICGGFTTFSAFAFENQSMLSAGNYLFVAIYILLSVTLCIAAVYAGITLIK